MIKSFGGAGWTPRFWRSVSSLSWRSCSGHHIFISKTLYLFPLAWISLRVRGLRWRDVGLARFRNWRKTLLIGLAAGVALEAFELFISQPLLIRITGRPPDLSDLASTRGHVGLLLLWILLIWTVGASGEEMVYRGYLMNRVTGLMRGTRTSWMVSLLAVSIVFGAAHLDQGITGQVENAIIGLLLGALYLGCGRNPCGHHSGPWCRRYNRLPVDFRGTIPHAALNARRGRCLNPEYNVRRIVMMRTLPPEMSGFVEVQPVLQAFKFPD